MQLSATQQYTPKRFFSDQLDIPKQWKSEFEPRFVLQMLSYEHVCSVMKVHAGLMFE